MAVLNVPVLRDLAPDLVVSDVITACGGMAAEMLGVPWVELNPHPLYRPSKGLPPIGSGLAPGVGRARPAARHRDAGADRPVVASRTCANARRPASRSACPQPIPVRCAD